MSMFSRSSERRKVTEDYILTDEEMPTVLDRSSSSSPKPHLENEKRMRREIANSNERRRMQSINAGFQSLKSLLPHTEGEKLSKAAILQQTSDYIHNLERDKTKLLANNAELKRIISDLTQDRDASLHLPGSPPPKRKKRDTESSDEGIILDDDYSRDELRREMIELRYQLDKERNQRKHWEQVAHDMEGRICQSQERQAQKEVQIQMQMQREKILYMQQLKKQEEEKQATLACERERQLQQEQTTYSSPMSQKNLEILAEALRQIEGDRVYIDERDERRFRIPQSEESEKESSSSSDREDTKSECSGRDSPVSYSSQEAELSDSRLSSLHLQHHHPHYTNIPQSYKDKSPIAMHLLNRPLPQQFYHRPGVIVHNSS